MEYRTLTFGRAEKGTRSVPVVISTDEPLDRGSYVEVLGHAPGDIDLSRAPLPLVECHDTSRLNIGVVENLTASNGKLRGVARFGTSQRGEEVFQDVLNGVVRSVSVGYVLTDEGTPDKSGSLRFKWMPYEVSCVPAPADTKAGFFRNFQEKIEMENNQLNPGADTMTRSQRIAQKGSVAAERERVADIISMASQFDDVKGIRAMADIAVRDGVPAEAFKDAILERVSHRGHNWQDMDLGLNQKEVRSYSISRAIEAQVSGDWSKAGYERELHQDLIRQVSHRQVQGLLVPLSDLAGAQRRDLLTSTPAWGGNLVATQHRGDLFVDALREKSAVLQLGAQFLNNLVGNVDIPTLTGDVTPGWMLTEDAFIAESQPTFGQILLSPKSCAAYTDVSRRLVKQSSPEVEQLIISSMMAAVGYSIDQAAISGAGTGGVPKGILAWGGVGSVVGTSLGWDAVLEFESDVADASVDLSSNGCGWLTTPAIRKLLKGRVKVAGYPEYLWQSPDNNMNGYRAIASKACSAGTLIFGDWSELLVANFGPIEILVDPYTKIQNAMISVRAIADIDVAVRHAGAFSVATSVT